MSVELNCPQKVRLFLEIYPFSYEKIVPKSKVRLTAQKRTDVGRPKLTPKVKLFLANYSFSLGYVIT